MPAYCFSTGVLIGSSVSRISVALATCDYDDWCIVSTPNVSGDNNTLWDVAVIDADDVWAVGWSHTTGSNSVETALAMHYNGSSWSISSMSISGSYSSSLYSVAAIGTNDVWAVGDYTTSSTGDDQTLIMHWNGSSWSQVSSPNAPSSNDNVLNAVDVVSANEAWAVGFYVNSSSTKKRTLIEHWINNQWTMVSSPNQTSNDNALQGISVVNSEDAWASGFYYGDATGLYTLALHWNGTEWEYLPSEDPGPADAFYEIEAIASDDIWSVGGYFASNRYISLAEHWDGSEWSHISTPNTITGTNSLRGLAAVESNGVWATGYGAGRTLTEYWDGSSWSIVQSDNQGTGGNFLYGVSINPGSSVVSGYAAWTVGYFIDTSTGRRQTLAMVYDHAGVAR